MGPKDRSVERTMKGLAAFEQRDADAFMSYARADYEWRPFLSSTIEGRVYRGAAGIRQWFADLEEMFESYSAELAQVRDLGDRVVVLGTVRAQGRGSGVPVESELGIVVDLDPAGLARRGVAFPSHAEALTHAGIAAP